MRLFHYTSVETAIKIIEGEKVWLSDSLGMNDLSEGLYISEIARPLVTELINNHPNGNAENEWMEMTLQSRSYFIFSLSCSGDLLQQWRSYGDNGTGVAIEFEVADDLLCERPPLWETPHATPVALHKCIYDIKEQTAIISELIRKHKELGEKETLADLWREIATYGIVMKHPSFHFEEEYRLVFCQSFIHSNNKVRRAVGIHGERKWRKGRYGLTSYYEYSIDRANIKGVRVGPSGGVLDLRMFRQMLQEYKWSGCPVTASECPHR